MLRESPCRKCELHKTDFPECLEDCEAIHDFQIFLKTKQETSLQEYSTFNPNRYCLILSQR